MADPEKSTRIHHRLHLDVERHPNGLVLGIQGELDVSGADAMRSVFDGLIAEQTPRIIVDLTELEFTDSTGLGVLIRAHKEATGRCAAFAVVCPPGNIRKLFAITHLTDALNVVGTRDEAWDVVLAPDQSPPR